MINSFRSNSHDSAFQAHIENEKINISRIMCLMGATLYLLFALIDIWALPSAISQALLIRGMIISGLLVVFTLTYHDVFIKYYDTILMTAYILSSLGIIWMINMSGAKDHAQNVYFAGLMLVIMTLFSWSHLQLINSIITTSVIILAYTWMSIVNDNVLSILDSPAFIANPSFLVSAAVIGFVNQIIRDRYLRENFLLQQSLKEQVVEKTKEAETHEHLANHDQLTGLPNSRYANDRLEKNLQRAKELDMSLVIMYLDLNGFKQVNDIYGHKAGDEVLRIVGKRLRSCVRNGDCAARLGGDEFAVGLMVEKTELGIAQDIREKIVKSICQPIGFEGNVLQIGTSVGMASYPSSGDKVSVLIEIADKRMYDAKQRMKKKALAESVGSSDEDIEFTSEGKREPVVIFPGA